MEPKRRVVAEVYTRDVRIRRPIWGRSSSLGQSERGEITSFSARSQRRLLLVARNARGIETLLTTTYPSVYPRDGRIVKDHLSALRKRLVRRGIGGLWWLEFQARGAPHFHFGLNGRVPRREIAEMWHDIIGSGDEGLKAGTRIEAIRDRERGLGAYAAKYVGKCEQKVVPREFANVGRFWGVFGNLDTGFLGEVGSGEGAEVEAASRALRRWAHVHGGGRQGRLFYDGSAVALQLLGGLAGRDDLGGSGDQGGGNDE